MDLEFCLKQTDRRTESCPAETFPVLESLLAKFALYFHVWPHEHLWGWILFPRSSAVVIMVGILLDECWSVTDF